MIIDIVLIYALGRGGLENILSLVSNELIKRGYRVRVIQGLEPQYSEWKRTIKEFYVLDSVRTTEQLDFNKIVEDYSNFIEKNGAPDVVVATHVPVMSYLCNGVLAYKNLLKNIPIVSWIHGQFYYFHGDSARFIQFADAHFAISEGIKKELDELSERKPVYLINNCVDTNVELVKRDTKKLNIIYLGRLSKEKSVETILEALKYVNGDWQLNIYGEGIEEEKLVNLSNELNINNNIVWHGWCDEPWEKIKEASVLVLSSNSEGFGLVMVEALCRGIPVVATKTDGPKSIIEDGSNGYLFDIDDYKRLAEILNDIQSSKIVLPTQDVCRDSIEKFTVKSVVDKFEKGIITEYNKKKLNGCNNNDDDVMAILLKNIKDDEMLEESIQRLNGINEDILKGYMMKNNSLNFITILNKAAIINYNTGSYEYVIPYLKLAYEMNNKNSETLYNLSVVLYNIGEFKTALQYLQCIDDKNSEVLELEAILKEKIQ